MVGCIKNKAEWLYHSNLFRKVTEKWTAVNCLSRVLLTTSLPVIELLEIKSRYPPRRRLMKLLASGGDGYNFRNCLYG
jgi:hypothetical protein